MNWDVILKYMHEVREADYISIKIALNNWYGGASDNTG